MKTIDECYQLYLSHIEINGYSGTFEQYLVDRLNDVLDREKKLAGRLAKVNQNPFNKKDQGSHMPMTAFNSDTCMVCGKSRDQHFKNIDDKRDKFFEKELKQLKKIFGIDLNKTQ